MVIFSEAGLLILTDPVEVNERRLPVLCSHKLEAGISAESDALREMDESGIVVCTLLYEGDQGSANIYQQRKGFATHCANATGGISIKTSQEEIPSRLAQMIERLRRRYTIGYSSSNTSRDGKFRRIKLTVTPELEKREGSVVVITRKGYYAK